MPSLRYLLHKKYIIAAVSITVSASAFTYVSKNFEVSKKNAPEDEALHFNTLSSNGKKKNVEINAAFDPNSYSPEQWIELGFSEKQTKTILKYKDILGGAFTSKEQFRKCYAVSDEMFLKLEPYLLLPEEGSSENKTQNSHRYEKYNYTEKPAKKSLHIKSAFNPDHLNFEDWKRIGFTEKQAASILKYKNYLGGSFQSKEKLQACYVISDDDFRAMEPYLRFNQANISEPKQIQHSQKSTISHSIFDPNDLDKEAWMKLGFTEKQANTILNFKNKIHKGSFKTKEDLAKCYAISEAKFKELEPYMSIKNRSFSETQNEKKNATDFSKTDLNSITFQELKEFGFDDKAAASFIGFRKKLGGFMTKNQILETYNIDKELMQKLIGIAPLNTSNVQKHYLKDAPETWLKEHPYFKYYADKIIFYRITFPDDKKIFAKMKLKPEVVSKMKLYLHSN